MRPQFGCSLDKHLDQAGSRLLSATAVLIGAEGDNEGRRPVRDDQEEHGEVQTVRDALERHLHQIQDPGRVKLGFPILGAVALREERIGKPEPQAAEERGHCQQTFENPEHSCGMRRLLAPSGLTDQVQREHEEQPVERRDQHVADELASGLCHRGVDVDSPPTLRKAIGDHQTETSD